MIRNKFLWHFTTVDLTNDNGYVNQAKRKVLINVATQKYLDCGYVLTTLRDPLALLFTVEHLWWSACDMNEFSAAEESVILHVLHGCGLWFWWDELMLRNLWSATSTEWSFWNVGSWGGGARGHGLGPLKRSWILCFFNLSLSFAQFLDPLPSLHFNCGKIMTEQNSFQTSKMDIYKIVYLVYKTRLHGNKHIKSIWFLWEVLDKMIDLLQIVWYRSFKFLLGQNTRLNN